MWRLRDWIIVERLRFDDFFRRSYHVTQNVMWIRIDFEFFWKWSNPDNLTIFFTRNHKFSLNNNPQKIVKVCLVLLSTADPFNLTDFSTKIMIDWSTKKVPNLNYFEIFLKLRIVGGRKSQTAKKSWKFDQSCWALQSPFNLTDFRPKKPDYMIKNYKLEFRTSETSRQKPKNYPIY